MRVNERKHFRLKAKLNVFRCPVKYLFEHNALSEDISEDGICLMTPYKLDIGERMDLSIYVPEKKEPIIATAEVVRRNETNDRNYPYLIGMKFRKISQDSKKQILDHIRFYLLKE
ncbi:MAG: PilZ domain-containing protein [Candidatus Omnitrophica bacterium]|nr:PilZ domain-containing protein [Candidatus Omnitrophota bacterium]